ncbi:MAG: hypothetical protein HLUCCX14_03760 [Marinobacter excellens HL-55]|uniref:Uncharacterized protein n=1 Tax=Marinobacter excellens HL-55 TaxID=1305731 RepID=A0A0P7ZLV9_9GAMM|nr:MAG: hypothetical protein HLUCCX14_03760 [Marinobacter excellens HL-55]
MISRRPRTAICLLFLLSLLAQPGLAGQPESGEAPPPVLTVAGISASVGEDDPRVLYILPWQNPSLPRRPRAELNNHAQNLLEPSLPRALENHRQFRDTLNPLVLEPITIDTDQGQP